MTISLHQRGVVMSSQVKHTHSHQDTPPNDLKAIVQRSYSESSKQRTVIEHRLHWKDYFGLNQWYKT